jgi:flagellar biogenesis protein FliO
MNKLFLVVVFVFFSPMLFAAQMKYNIDDSKLTIRINFSEPYQIISKSKKENKYIALLKVSEKVNINQEFWGIPLEHLVSEQSGDKLKLIFKYSHSALVPDIITNKNILDININFPKEEKANYSAGKTYIRLFVGLTLMIIFILIIYFFIKIFFKKNISTEIPGVGRGLGKVDIMPGKSLYFYELADHIYILGITGDSVSLIDKITDDDEVNTIKAGFSRGKDFSTYFKFFSKDNEIKKDVDISSTIIKDKVDSLRKK